MNNLNMFKCSACDGKVYASQKALNKHGRLKHNLFNSVIYECQEVHCKETFSSKRKLKKHHAQHKSNRNRMGLKTMKSKTKREHYECFNCGVTFYRKSELINHVKIHQNRHKRLLCPVGECNFFHNRYKALHKHIIENHNIVIEQEVYEFETMTEFELWKQKTEEDLGACYVKDTSKKLLKDGVRMYYECHRYLAPRQKKNMKKHSKSMGTNKVNKACPSIFHVTKTGDKICVILYPVHMGHSKEIGRLRINKLERDKIAGKLSAGVTVDRVLHDIRDNAKADQQKRIDLIEKKDIYNIARDYSIGYSTKRHSNDAISVKLWVETMRKLEYNPILYYKEQGLEDSRFEKDDFVLIIMSEFQANSFLLFGNDKICIDGTHSLNQYGFQLFSIVVIDEYGSGIPATFCFSNRSDITLFNHLFSCVRDKIGTISAKVFMSDDYPAFYTAWKTVMGEVTQKLLCTWHINKNWIQNLNKICNKEKRDLVYKSLKVLQKEMEEEAFLTQLNNFINQLQTDPDTFEFFQYFLRTYLDRAHMWAYCYRKYAGINTNMYLESLHKMIKHFYLQGKKCKRLDKTINALMNLVRDKMFERIIKFEKHKSTDKIQKIRKSHNKALSIPENFIKAHTENEWLVLSQDDELNYIVKKQSEDCDNICGLKCQLCQICVHAFTCSCPDNVINLNICKHIHACCLQYSLKTSFSDPLSTDTFNNSCLDSDLIGNNSTNKDLLNSKLEIIIGLNNKYNLTDANANQISKKLDKIIDLYNNSDFKVKEKTNIKQNIEPQARMFISKKRKRPNKNVEPALHPHEAKVIKLALLSDPNTKIPNIQVGFDHTYL